MVYRQNSNGMFQLYEEGLHKLASLLKNSEVEHRAEYKKNNLHRIRIGQTYVYHSEKDHEGVRVVFNAMKSLHVSPEEAFGLFC